MKQNYKLFQAKVGLEMHTICDEYWDGSEKDVKKVLDRINEVRKNGTKQEASQIISAYELAKREQVNEWGTTEYYINPESFIKAVLQGA